MRHFAPGPLVLCTVLVTVLLPLSALAQSPPAGEPPQRVTLGDTWLGVASLKTLNRAAQAPRQASSDPVGDGIGYGALIGAGVGLGVMAVLYNACDGSCDAPAAGPMYLGAAAMGAGIGAAAGWAVDAARKSSGRRVSVSAVVAPKRQSVRVAVRF